MATPTTIKCQIAVPSNGNGDAENVFNLTLTLLVEKIEEDEFDVNLGASLMGDGDGEPIPTGPGMPIEDPHPGSDMLVS